jgi:hypothetical protein
VRSHTFIRKASATTGKDAGKRAVAALVEEGVCAQIENKLYIYFQPRTRVDVLDSIIARMRRKARSSGVKKEEDIDPAPPSMIPIAELISLGKKRRLDVSAAAASPSVPSRIPECSAAASPSVPGRRNAQYPLEPGEAQEPALPATATVPEPATAIRIGRAQGPDPDTSEMGRYGAPSSDPLRKFEWRM